MEMKGKQDSPGVAGLKESIEADITSALIVVLPTHSKDRKVRKCKI